MKVVRKKRTLMRAWTGDASHVRDALRGGHLLHIEQAGFIA